MFVGLGLHIAFAIAMCIHVVKTGREMYWLFIILAFPGMGPLVYLIVAVLPDLMNGGMARGLTKAARQALNPEGEYRAARDLVEDSPTVGNRMRLAAAAMERGPAAGPAMPRGRRSPPPGRQPTAPGERSGAAKQQP